MAKESRFTGTAWALVGDPNIMELHRLELKNGVVVSDTLVTRDIGMITVATLDREVKTSLVNAGMI